MILLVDKIEKSFGARVLFSGASFQINPGERFALVGPNGAGKTTILQTISGLLRPKSGKISFDGVDITGHSPNKILVRGLAQVPEGRRVFGQMTVLENLEMGAFTRRDTAGIREDLEITSNVRIRDVEEAQQRIVGIIRDLEERSELIILKGGKDDIIA